METLLVVVAAIVGGLIVSLVLSIAIGYMLHRAALGIGAADPEPESPPIGEDARPSPSGAPAVLGLQGKIDLQDIRGCRFCRQVRRFFLRKRDGVNS